MLEIAEFWGCCLAALLCFFASICANDIAFPTFTTIEHVWVDIWISSTILFFPCHLQTFPNLIKTIGKINPDLHFFTDTSRMKGDGEIDGQDYHFVIRSQFEEYVNSKRFVEHGEYDKQYYGTSLDAVRTVINSGKICVLNLQPVSLQILHDSDLKPYVVFLTPPTLQTYRQQRAKYGEACKVGKPCFKDIFKIIAEFSIAGGRVSWLGSHSSRYGRKLWTLFRFSYSVWWCRLRLPTIDVRNQLARKGTPVGTCQMGPLNLMCCIYDLPKNNAWTKKTYHS